MQTLVSRSIRKFFPSNSNAFWGLLGYSVLLMGLLTDAPTWAEDGLAPLEQRFYATTFAQEPLKDRLDRLENSVFGSPQSGTEVQRSQRLLDLLPPIKQTAATPEGNQFNSDSVQTPQLDANGPNQAQDATDYPTVTRLERQILGRDFAREGVQSRLSRLESKVFGQPSPQLSLVDRVDKLLAQVPNATGATASANPAPNVLDQLPTDSSQFTASKRDVYTKIEALERKQFNGKTFPNGLLSERLDKLEVQQFTKTFSGESIDSRVNRLMALHNSNTKTAVGKNYQTLQNTPSSFGYQPQPNIYNVAPSSSYPVGASSQKPVNIQIGSAFGSSSFSQFSPQMQAMLPPSVRAQMGATSSGTIIGSPSTVVMDRATTGNSGFQTYGNNNIQHYNYYGLPVGSVQQQSSTTVIQPDGSQVVYGYPGNQPGSLPNPAYIGDPAVFQRVNQLEMNVFGLVNTVEAMPVRLSKLEAALAGQVNPQLPDVERLNNLEKIYRVQAASKLLGQGRAANIGRGLGGLFTGIPLTPPGGITAPLNMPVSPILPGR